MRRAPPLAVLFLALLAAAGRADEVSDDIRVLRDPAAGVDAKGGACSRLMDLGAAAAPAVPALVPLLTSREEILRDYAVTTLTKIGPGASKALPALKKMAVGDPQPELRQLAAEAIKKIGEEHSSARAARPARKAETSSGAGRRVDVERPGAAIPAMSARPPLEVRQGNYFRWAAPRGWKETETISGVTLTSPDGRTLATSQILMRSAGQTTPRGFLQWVLGQDPEYQGAQVEAVSDLPDAPSGYGIPWKIQEFQVRYRVNGIPARGSWTVGVCDYYGVFDAAVVAYQAPVGQWESAKHWLAEVARSITITNAAQVAGNNTLIPVRNHPLDNSGLMESWRQKGLSEDRISKAQREGTMGYERVKDPDTGRVWEMPLENYDATRGGYRNPARPDELLQPTQPGE